MADLIEDAGGLEGGFGRLQVSLAQVVRVHMERLLEVLQRFAKVTHANLELAKVRVHLRGHNVRGAEHFEAAIDARLEQEVGVFHIAMGDVQVCHDVVDGDLHWVIVAPMVVKDSQRLAKVDVRMLRIAVHKMSLDQDAVELNGLRMQWAKRGIEGVERHLSLHDRLVPHLLVQGDLTHGEESLNVVSVVDILRESALHVARFDGLLDAFFCQVLVRLLRDYSVGQALKTERFDLGSANESTLRSFRAPKWILSVEEVLVDKKLVNVGLIEVGGRWYT